MNNIKEKIIKTIKNLIHDFEEYPDKYLTESDVRCALVNKLMKDPAFNELYKTEDNSKSVPIHSEVRWYGQSGKLKWRSDIVIFDVSSLRVKNDIFRLPSKGFSFNKPWAIIEIKLRRINGESDRAFIKKIKDDSEKLSNIRVEVSGDYFCCLVVFDKKGNINQNIAKNSNIRIYYKFANSKNTKNILTS